MEIFLSKAKSEGNQKINVAFIKRKNKGEDADHLKSLTVANEIKIKIKTK